MAVKAARKTEGIDAMETEMPYRSARAGAEPGCYDWSGHWIPRRRHTFRDHLGVVVLTLAAVVHWSGDVVFAQGRTGARVARSAAPSEVTNATLPRAVGDMRAAMLQAVASGRLDELKALVELNEIAPDFGTGTRGDPIAIWRAQSGDGTGRDVLEALGRVLASRPALEPLGPDIENNKLYVWPYLAVHRVDVPLSAEEVADAAVVGTPAEVAALKAGQPWLGWRVTISPEGVWHAFYRGN